MAPAKTLSEAEIERRLQRVEAYLVRTMRSCPAPGIAPFTVGELLLITGTVMLPALVIFVFAISQHS
jgi:hypothetical protein